MRVNNGDSKTRLLLIVYWVDTHSEYIVLWFWNKKKIKKPSGQINKKYSLNFRKILTVILDVKGLYYIGLIHFSSPKFK